MLFFKKLAPKITADGVAVKRSISADIGAKLMCVFAAVCLWFYVIDADSPTYKDTFSGVELQFTENLKGFEVLSSERNTIDVVLSGKRSDINTMRNSDITATVDISGITEAGEYPLNIVVSTSNETSVEDYSPKSIYVYLDKSSSRSVSVRADYTGGTSDDKALKIGQLEPSKKLVTIYGPEEALSEVEAAEVTVDLNLISHSVSMTNKPLVLVSSDGTVINNQYIRLEDKAVDVYVPVYMEKELKVVPAFRYNCFDSAHVSYTVNPSAVTVRGDIEDVETLEYINTSPIDDKTIGNARIVQADYQLPDNISLVGVRGKCSVNIGVTDYTEKNITLNYRRINVEDLAVDMEAVPEESISVKVCGSADALSQISASDLAASVSAKGLSEGTHYGLPVDIAFADSQTKNAYIADSEYTTNLRLQKVNEEANNE